MDESLKDALGIQESVVGAFKAFLCLNAPISIDSRIDSLIKYGTESIPFLEIVLGLEREFSIHLPDQMLCKAETLRDIAEIIMVSIPASK